jgi:hypothetical protein
VEQAKVDKLSECILRKQLATPTSARWQSEPPAATTSTLIFILGMFRVSDKTLNKDYVTLGKERGYMAAPGETRLYRVSN